MKHLHFLKKVGSHFKCIHPNCSSRFTKDRVIDKWIGCPQCGISFIATPLVCNNKLLKCPDCRKLTDSIRESEWAPTKSINTAIALNEQNQLNKFKQTLIAKKTIELDVVEQLKEERKRKAEEKKQTKEAITDILQEDILILNAPMFLPNDAEKELS